MAKINYGRVLLGGFVAAVVGSGLAILIDGVILAPQWAKEFEVFGRRDYSMNWIHVSLLGLAMGIVEVWVYAAIRPRYGAGPLTAIYAGMAVWVLAGLVPNVATLGSSGLFTPMLVFWTTAGSFLEWGIVAALVGAALYKEGPSGSQAVAARA